MTIEEAKKEICRVNKLGYLSVPNSETEYRIALGTIQGYKAKEEELKGALIIPKWVKLVNIIQSQEGEYKTFVADYYSIIEGVGTHPHEALRNALEQIETK